MRLRQIALVAKDLEPVVADLCAVLGIEVGFNDPGVAEFGLRNAVMPIGDTFLEVVSPAQPNTTAGRYLERRKGDGGYMVIIQSDDLAVDRQRLDRLGVRIVWEIDLADARSVHLHPRDIGGAIVSLDAMDPPESWKWAGPRWQEAVRTEVTRAIAGVEVQCADPAARAQRWADCLGRRAVQADGSPRIQLDRGIIRFVPDRDGRGEGVSAIDLELADPARFLTSARARGLITDGNCVRIGGVRLGPARD
jgi:hypothetical protein